MYAIIKTGGKQYKVAAGSRIIVEKLIGEPETIIEFTDVLMVEDAGNLRVGTPMVPDVKVIARIDAQSRGKKINGFTYKPKKHQHHRYGHRQSQTELTVQSIEA